MTNITNYNLSAFCKTMENKDSKYLEYMQDGIDNINDWFNNYWISQSSKQISEDIYHHLSYYIKRITKIFKDFNAEIASKVNIHNMDPQNVNKLFYKGFSISSPRINKLLNLNDTLPDGKVGNLFDQTSVSKAFNDLVSAIEDASKTLKSTVVGCELISFTKRKSFERLIMTEEKTITNAIDDIIYIISTTYDV